MPSRDRTSCRGVCSSTRHREQQARAAGAERVTERDGAAVDVHLLTIEAELFFDREILAGERLVHFDQIEVVERQAGALERLPRGRRRTHAHVRRIDAHRGPRRQARDRASALSPAPPSPTPGSARPPPSTMPLALPAVTVPSFENAAGSLASPSSVVSGRMWSSLSTTVTPLRVLISTGTTSSVKRPSAHALRRELLAAQRERVLLLARDAVLAGALLRGLRHEEAAVRIEQRFVQIVLELALAESKPRAQAAHRRAAPGSCSRCRRPARSRLRRVE